MTNSEKILSLVLGGITVLSAIGGVVYKFSNLETRVSYLESRLDKLNPTVGVRGGMCGSLIEAQIAAIARKDETATKSFQEQLNQLNCSDFYTSEAAMERKPDDSTDDDVKSGE